MPTYSPAQARIEIEKLVETFRLNETALHHAPEAQIENDFLRPLFRYLNWNVDNAGLSRAQWEFVLQRTERGKRPDYELWLDARRVLIMDAKKVKYEMHDPRWLNQVYAYAYSTQNDAPARKTDFAILTDFQEFIVLDCTLLAGTPKAINNFRVLDWRYPDYVARFDELWELFERNNVLAASRTRDAGLWARYLSPKKVRANRVPPDKAFLSALDDVKTGWRVRLAKDMKKHNPALGGDVLTAAVQLWIDRLIFIKVLSDREIEDDYLAQMADVVERDGLAENNFGWFAATRGIFQKLNQIYNGSIFAPRPELEAVNVSNKVVREIIGELLPENSPYNFGSLPVEILGTIYERFLGRVVHATEKQVRIEDKPEVRKAGGVFYTPQYIVNYIVANTVGTLLAECKTPADVAQLKILDPACGSGSFLIGAYDALIQWHENYYTHLPTVISSGARNLNSRARDFSQGRLEMTKGRDRDAAYYDDDGRVRLTAKLKRQILVNNLFGVDIDPQAVEVTRLSLSLKALEDTRHSELYQEVDLFHQRVLPDLTNNIKCGNSLIGTDFIFTDAEELKRVKPFDWHAEFPQVFGARETRRVFETTANRAASALENPSGLGFDARGFDAVIGNPPYVRMESFVSAKDYLRVHYQTHSDRADIFFYFVERGINLLHQNGKFGLILSNTFTRSRAGQTLRAFLSQNLNLTVIVEFGDFTPFEDASVYPIIVLGEKSKSRASAVPYVVQENNPELLPDSDAFGIAHLLPQESLSDAAWIFDDSDTTKLREKLLNQHPSLAAQYGGVGMGIKTGLNEAFIVDRKTRQRILERNPDAAKIIKPYIGGKNLDHWIYTWDDEWLIYTPRGIDMSQYPEVLEFMKPFKSKLQSRATNQEWYELQQAQEAYASNFGNQKIVFPDMSRYPKFCLDNGGMYFSNTVYFIGSDSRYLLGILNSKLVWFVIRGLSNALRGGLWRFRLFAGHIERLPIRTIDFTNPADGARHGKMVALVERMLSLHQQRAAAQTETDQQLFQRQIDATDKLIDALVYELYGLTDEEIKIVEEG